VTGGIEEPLLRGLFREAGELLTPFGKIVHQVLKEVIHNGIN
jgi:hypothetical protein